MRKVLTLLNAAFLFAACSTPKYTYHFDRYDYNSGKKKAAPLEQIATLSVNEKTLVASVSEKMVYTTEEETSVVLKKEIADKIKAISREDRKELKNEIKKSFEENKKIEFDRSPRTSNMARDMKFAAISGGVGIILLIIGGATVLYILGAALILVGFYFLIRWLSHPHRH
jgi:hypothetical protein